MRTFLIFSVISCFLGLVFAKPLSSIVEQNRETGEADYEGNEESAATDYQQDDQEPSIESQDETNNNGRREVGQENAHLPDLSNNPYKQRISDMSGISRDARNGKISSINADPNEKPIMKCQQSDPYVENNDQEARQHSSDNSYKINRAQNPEFDNNINKRAMLSANANDEGDFLFENNRDQLNKADKIEYSRDGDPTRLFKQPIFNIPGENRELPDFKRYEKFRLNRNRRQTQKTNSKETNESTPSGERESKEEDTINEDEESAIKRHVKKLSEQELDDLLSTLSDDKRNLLKKIMENDFDNDDDTINKREITKKAGAVEQNNYIENGQFDSNKDQGLNSNVEDTNTETILTRETTETSKKNMGATEVVEAMPFKNTGSSDKSENKLDLANQREDDVKEIKSESNIDLDSKKPDNDFELESNSQIMSKIENKREANISEMTVPDDTQIGDRDYNLKDSQGTVNNQEMFLPEDELSEIMNEETEQHNAYKNGFKREASFDDSSDLSDSLKSLEDSFPNSNAYDESNLLTGSDMAPLIRVKRTDAGASVMKRAANIMADSNVPYFPNKGENDDEDNDEGSEFNDDGFYDRTSNYARSNDYNKAFNFHCAKDGEKFLTKKSGHNYGNENLESDTMNLGSDTDNMMTGPEGINDNLMFNGLRNRRTLDENDYNNKSSDDKAKEVSPERRLRSTPLMDNQSKTVSETNINVPVPGYQENDAFGPLPRGYDGDLGRYKRVRRVKQMQDSLSPN